MFFTDSRLGSGAVAGIVIATFILVIIIAMCLAVYLIKRRGAEDKTDVEATIMAQIKTEINANTVPNTVVNHGAEFAHVNTK